MDSNVTVGITLVVVGILLFTVVSQIAGMLMTLAGLIYLVVAATRGRRTG